LPRTIFVQTGQVQPFSDTILPCLDSSARIVLITGDHDATLPQQVDVRYPHFFQRATWDSWLKDERIVHVFVEHLDEASVEKVTPIPLGINPKELAGQNADHDVDHMQSTTLDVDILVRPLQALLVDRVRDGLGQWAERARVKTLCGSAWKGFCDPSPWPGIPRQRFFESIQAYPFLLCVHGGGLDPNPKAWTALMAGVIPIIKRFPGDAVYCGLPVVRIGEWNEKSLSGEQMEQWRQQLSPHFSDEEKRKVWVKRLMSAYWWSLVEDSLTRPYEPLPLCPEQIALDA